MTTIIPRAESEQRITDTPKVTPEMLERARTFADIYGRPVGEFLVEMQRCESHARSVIGPVNRYAGGLRAIISGDVRFHTSPVGRSAQMVAIDDPVPPNRAGLDQSIDAAVAEIDRWADELDPDVAVVWRSWTSEPTPPISMAMLEEMFAQCYADAAKPESNPELDALLARTMPVGGFPDRYVIHTDPAVPRGQVWIVPPGTTWVGFKGLSHT